MPVNTAALKTFAPAMRRQLLEAVGRKLDLLLNSQTPDTLSTYATQIAELREQEAENREQLLERVSYTWFNRLCALRYLDAKGWHPFGCKVLMPAAEGETQPELLKLMRAGSLPAELKPHTNEARLHGLLDGQIPPAMAGSDPQGEVYRELVLASCRSYHQLLPELFEALDDSSELLLPEDLLTERSISAGFRAEISDQDCADVELLGWLYQFYIAEKKEEVMARKKVVPTEDIPAVTQLFTPHWIVRYLIENSLGRLWLRSRPGSRLKEHMPYYVDDLDAQAPKGDLIVAGPEEIKLLDPACGSGHMLTYAFDLLVKIWEEDGYSPTEIPQKIFANNIFGLEICPRAAQLTQFALMCKAREISRTAFRSPVQSHIMCLQDVAIEPDQLSAWMQSSGISFSQAELSQIHQFRNSAQACGSLIKPILDEKGLASIKSKIDTSIKPNDVLTRDLCRKIDLVLSQALMLTRPYHVVVANPPYMDLGDMNSGLKGFIETGFQETKQGMDATFINRCTAFARGGGRVAMITQRSWMFLSRLESFRQQFIQDNRLESMLYLGPRVFPEIAGEKVQNTAFVALNRPRGQGDLTLFYRLTTEKGVDKHEAFLNRRHKYMVDVSVLNDIPGSPLAFWASKKLRSAFAAGRTLNDVAEPRVGLDTGDNPRFIRLWHEPAFDRLFLTASTISEFHQSGKKWAPHSKGGNYRRWYGNLQEVIAFSQIDYAKLGSQGNKLPSRQYYFKPGMFYTRVSTEPFSLRESPVGVTFNSASPTIFPQENFKSTVFGLLNSRVVHSILECLSPTLNYQAGELRKIPLPASMLEVEACQLVDQCVSLARYDWDNFEGSWNFADSPLIRSGNWKVDPKIPGGTWKGKSLGGSWSNYSDYCNAAISRIQELETENNRLWIDAYGLQDELSPEVPVDEITLARADRRKDIAAFISYAAGCMMGRYSLDQPGLILADSRDSQAEQLAAYEAKVGKPLSEVQFKPDPDGIIPVLDGEWFEDDIVARTREFLGVTFPESSVAENLRFIEESLGKDIRKYFCSDFYKDHLQTYKKRPIYWMVQSPKKGFACLIYLHRYTKYTLNQVLNNYFRPYLQKLEARLAQLGLDQLNDELPARERTAARKEAEKITKVLKECQAWEQDALLPLAQQRIELDLDDGVKVNYLKLQDVLAPIPGLAAKED